MLFSPQARIQEYYSLKNKGLINQRDEFFPSVHYPPITMYPFISPVAVYDGYSLPQDELLDVYVHIPFCEKQCLFCHYPVFSGSHLTDEKDRYLRALFKEMRIFLERMKKQKIKARTVLIGGGTPTFLSRKQLQFFLDNFLELVDLSQCSQFNYDLDPKTMLGSEGLDRLIMMKKAGVNRLTIGVQEFQENILQQMNRSHSAQEAKLSIERSLELGFQTNIEFIYGFPGQTMDSWQSTISQAIATNAQEIQLYRLKIIPYGDKVGFIQKECTQHKELNHSIETLVAMKQLAMDILAEKGYSENLTRVFTKEKKYYSHYAFNQCCQLYDQVGFGLTAFSSLRDRFVLNTQDLANYYELIEAGALPVNRGLIRNISEQNKWAIVLPLKNRVINKQTFKRITGLCIEATKEYKILQMLISQGLVVENSREISLTSVGRFYADDICALFYSAEYIPFPKELYVQGELNPYLVQTRF